MQQVVHNNTKGTAILPQPREEDKLKIKSCEKKEKSVAELVIEVSAEEFNNAINDAYRKNRNRISVPGFRKGKAPRGIIERMYGTSVFHSDALEIIMPDVLNQAVTESDLKIISVPEATDFNINDDDGSVSITVTAYLLPEVKLGEYKGLSAYKPHVEVPDSEIDREIADIRMRNARIEKVDRPASNGDIAVIDYEGFIEGEPFEGGKAEGYELELGSITFIPGFEEKLHGMCAGEDRDLDLVFPESYAEHLAGKPVIFKVKMLEVKEKQLPDLDDEFAKDVSEFDTFNDYKADIRDKQTKAKQAEADAEFENTLMEKIAETTEAGIPDVMVEQQMDDSMRNFARQISSYGMDPSSYLKMMNTTPEAFRENMRESSEKQVKIMLALAKIAELEGIEVSDEDIENEYKEASAQYGMEIEKLKESVGEERIATDIKMRRAAKIVTDSAIAEAKKPAGEENADRKKSKKASAAKNKPGKTEDDDSGPTGQGAVPADEETAGDEEAVKPVAAKKPARKPKNQDGSSSKGDETK